MTRDHKWTRRQILQALTAVPGLWLLHRGRTRAADGALPPYDPAGHRWGFAVVTTPCIGCCACMRACRAENRVPAGNYRTWIERYAVRPDGQVDVDAPEDEARPFPPIDRQVAKAFFVPKLCNHCEKSVCNQVCPVGAAYKSEDGVVLVDSKHCIGCGYCVQACPYGSRFINRETHLADKCTLCYHRITRGEKPACVLACPRDARLFGDLNQPTGRLSTILRQRRYRLLKPEMGTHPKCFYMGLDREVV